MGFLVTWNLHDREPEPIDAAAFVSRGRSVEFVDGHGRVVREIISGEIRRIDPVERSEGAPPLG